MHVSRGYHRYIYACITYVHQGMLAYLCLDVLNYLNCKYAYTQRTHIEISFVY